MKKSAALLMFALVLGAVAPAHAQLTPKQIFDKCNISVVTIETQKSSGTAFFGPDGRLYTAYHVLAGADTATITFANGYKEAVAGVLAADKARDIAVLWVSQPFYGPKLGDYSALTPGEAIVVIGSPLGLSQTVTAGIVSAKRTEGGVDKLQLSASVSHGSSGSPVFNSKGEVVGMVVSTLVDGQSLNFAVAGKELKIETPIPLKTIFQGSSSTSDKMPEVQNPSKARPGDIDMDTVMSMYSKISGSPVEAQRLSSTPDFALNVLVPKDASWLSESDIKTWAKSELSRDAPSAKVLSEQETSDRIKSLKYTSLAVDYLNDWDKCFRNMAINISFRKEPSNDTTEYWVDCCFERGAITKYGVDLVRSYDDGLFGSFEKSDDSQTIVRDAIQKLIKNFADKWNVLNKKTE